jgi:hypothetical protein
MSDAVRTSLVIYFSAYFHLLQNIFIFYALAGGKCAPEEKSEQSNNHTAINLETKIRMICKYEGVQRLSTIAPELGFAVSTVITV